MKLDEYSALEKKALQRVGFFDSLLLPVEERVPIAPSKNRSSELNRKNGRLEELRQQYSAYPCAAQMHSQWDEPFTQEIDLATFRGDSAYMWQYRDGNVPLTYIATYYHHRLSTNADLLEKCTEDGSFGPYSLTLQNDLVTRDRLDSVTELGFLRELFSLNELSQLRILDIGSGYGRLAWRINQCFPNIQMLCVDAVPESAFLCEYYLTYREASPHVRMVPLPTLTTELSQSPIDLAIAVNSLSECTAAAMEWWLDLLEAHRVPYIMLVPHAAFEGGREIYSTELRGTEKIPMLPLLERRGYRRTIMQPKYKEAAMQLYGVSPTYFHVFSRQSL